MGNYDPTAFPDRQMYFWEVGSTGSLAWAPPVLAQAAYHVTRAPAELLAAYVRESQTLNGHHDASTAITHILTHHTDYPPADVESLLQGLEEIALTGALSSLRAESAFRLSIPGSRRALHPIPGAFPRLARVYRESSDVLVRRMVVNVMGDLTDRGEAAAFLERVASEEPPGGIAGRALASLLTMGDEGRLVLKRLHETKAVRDPEVSMDLSTIAKNGYRLKR